MNNDNKLVPVGTPVYDHRYGKGRIASNTEDEPKPYVVTFNFLDIVSRYTIDGKENVGDISKILSLKEYDLSNGGFVPLSDFDKPAKGERGFFWDSGYSNKSFNYSKIKDIIADSDGHSKYIDLENNKWDYFQRKPPILHGDDEQSIIDSIIANGKSF